MRLLRDTNFAGISTIEWLIRCFTFPHFVSASRIFPISVKPP
jgi:hypothetical protein